MAYLTVCEPPPVFWSIRMGSRDGHFCNERRYFNLKTPMFPLENLKWVFKVKLKKYKRKENKWERVNENGNKPLLLPLKEER